ncbi:hypothetical protein SSX86_014265 [Deinandra increscens subsp. villosa]|uniref:methionyl-tRNA formyltransferase n=1 Tax=Deinandra increscens subsp. villosa TaxID=3103831 RepID=A0AAP0D1L9_9ASTR
MSAGVYSVVVDADHQKVKVYGNVNVDSTTLINKLVKSGKYAKLWPSADQETQDFINGGNGNINDQNQIQNLIKSLNGPKSQALLTPGYPRSLEDQMSFERYLKQNMDMENHPQFGSGFVDLEGSQLFGRSNGGLQTYHDHQSRMPEAFLSDFSELEPDLCITAAYGKMLPTKFLKIPSLGTVNIHPSLLPLYRGAAPVQRALQDGVRKTGVSLAFTVHALDAGPIIACEKVEIDNRVKAPELLDLLFARGSKLLLQELPSIFDGSASTKAEAQDDSKATVAPKISQEESWLSFDQKALTVHNKVRAFAGWPGTRARILVTDENSDKCSELELKVITARVYYGNVQSSEYDEVIFRKGSLIIPCGQHTALEVLEVQLPGEKVVNAAAFWNGLRGQKLKKLQL